MTNKKWKEGSFTINLGGVNSLMGDTSKEKKKGPGRPRSSTKAITQGNTPEDGTKEGERRATYIVRKDLIEKMESIAYWDRKMIKEAVNEALEDYIKKYEKSNGKVKPKPKK